jgi:hypothetical protein
MVGSSRPRELSGFQKMAIGQTDEKGRCNPFPMRNVYWSSLISWGPYPGSSTESLCHEDYPKLHGKIRRIFGNPEWGWKVIPSEMG